jgi:peroxiredoxin 2/4
MAVLVGKKAPDFRAKAVAGDRIIEEFTLSQFEGKKYVLFFFYPLDFTFVCPTELHAFQERLEEFASRDVQVIGCSVDSHFSHLAWLGTPAKQGGICGVSYPIVADLTKSIARDFDVLTGDGSVAYRGLFLIDRQGIVRHQVVNDLPLGRSVAEALRMVEALQFFEANGEVCPANWQRGAATIKPDLAGSREYFSSAHA